jgi:hypothetical protein
MTFLELYGDALDQELGTADRTRLFLTAKRKLAINVAQTEFLRLTNCYVRRAEIDLEDGTHEYDLLAAIGDSNFFRLDGARELPVIQRESSTGDYTYIGGDDFVRRSTDWLDRHSPGWRNSGHSGTPDAWYVRQDNGTLLVGIAPPPSIPAGDEWLLLVPYVAVPDTMTSDSDIPFSTSSNAQSSLIPFHQALVHHAASKLELLRKNYGASDRQTQLFAGYAADFLQSRQPDGPQHVTMHHDYLGSANKHRSTFGDTGDPRR